MACGWQRSCGSILPRGELWLQLLDLGALSRGVAGRSPRRLFYLDVFLSSNEDIPYLGDGILHQMFIEGVGNLKPTDEGSDGYVLVAVVYQRPLTLKVGNVVLQTVPSFRLDCEEVVDVPLEFPSRRKLVVECVSYFMKVPE